MAASIIFLSWTALANEFPPCQNPLPFEDCDDNGVICEPDEGQKFEGLHVSNGLYAFSRVQIEFSSAKPQQIDVYESDHWKLWVRWALDALGRPSQSDNSATSTVETGSSFYISPFGTTAFDVKTKHLLLNCTLPMQEQRASDFLPAEISSYFSFLSLGDAVFLLVAFCIMTFVLSDKLAQNPLVQCASVGPTILILLLLFVLSLGWQRSGWTVAAGIAAYSVGKDQDLTKQFEEYAFVAMLALLLITAFITLAIQSNKCCCCSQEDARQRFKSIQYFVQGAIKAGCVVLTFILTGSFTWAFGLVTFMIVLYLALWIMCPSGQTESELNHLHRE